MKITEHLSKELQAVRIVLQGAGIDPYEYISVAYAVKDMTTKYAALETAVREVPENTAQFIYAGKGSWSEFNQHDRIVAATGARAVAEALAALLSTRPDAGKESE